MARTLAGRFVVVTGGGRGIGATVAIRAELGCSGVEISPERAASEERAASASQSRGAR